MRQLKVAYFKRIGIELILVPLDRAFGNKSHSEKSEIIRNLHLDATASGMKGTVVPIWNDDGHRHFIAPMELHPFLRGFRWSEVMDSVNGVIEFRT